MNKSFADQFSQIPNPSGFDYLRILLAILIVLWHGILVSTGDDTWAWDSIFRPLPGILLPMFFCLSGFLVAISLERVGILRQFLMLRVLRIVPALCLETVLSAVILGGFLTSLPLMDYFTSTGFFAYFKNIFGIVQFNLPGVYVDNPLSGVVNQNLWTLPREFQCYLLLSILFMFGLFSRPKVILTILLVATPLLTWHILPLYAEKQKTPPTSFCLVLAFFWGVYFYRDRLNLLRSGKLAAVCLACALALLYRADTQYLALPFVAYATIYIGTSNLPRKTFLLKGDYSYGLYLYGFPIQQASVAILGVSANYFTTVTCGLVFGLTLAWLSWHYVEHPVLRNRVVIIDRVNRVLRLPRFMRG
ncbi:MAG: acyltransferase [Pseudomonadota bacterium]